MQQLNKSWGLGDVIVFVTATKIDRKGSCQHQGLPDVGRSVTDSYDAAGCANLSRSSNLGLPVVIGSTGSM